MEGFEYFGQEAHSGSVLLGGYIRVGIWCILTLGVCSLDVMVLSRLVLGISLVSNVSASAGCGTELRPIVEGTYWDMH